jgi:Fe2+ or Zn2+ uptake regulation protein
MRTNIYKDKIIKLFEKNHLLSIPDIHKKMKDADYSTVCRNVGQLVADEDIKKVVFDKDVVMYEINNTEHNHDHFVCTDCGLVDELDRSFINLSSLKQCVVKDVVVKGLCKNCN